MRRPAVLGSLVAILLLIGCRTQNSAEVLNETSNRPDLSFLRYASLAELQNHLNQGSITAESLTRYYLERIERLNRQGPNLHAVVNVNPNALDDARKLDASRARLKKISPLYGIPILIKDNIETQDPMPTTAGSLALKDFRSNKDAQVVAQLRAQGAVILGKANLSQWSGLRGPPGWSSTGGQTINPYSPEFGTCGSSSGSAVSVAAALAPVALGTETSYSIVCPASYNNVVGIKPSRGLVSGDGTVPISKRQDIIGPMAKRVADAALLLDEIVTRQKPQAQPIGHYSQALIADGLKGKRIGYFPEPERADDPDMLMLWQQALLDLGNAGAILVKLQAADFEFSKCEEIKIILHEFAIDINGYLARLSKDQPIHSLAELVKFNQETAGEALSSGDDFVAKAIKAPSKSEFNSMLKTCLTLGERLMQNMRSQRLDAIASPGLSKLTPILAIYGSPYMNLPMGFTKEKKRPIGLNFYVQNFREDLLINLGYGYEQATGERHIRYPEDMGP